MKKFGEVKCGGLLGLEMVTYALFLVAHVECVPMVTNAVKCDPMVRDGADISKDRTTDDVQYSIPVNRFLVAICVSRSSLVAVS